jgi:hypothetical protein
VSRARSRGVPRAWHVLLVVLSAPPLLHAAGTDGPLPSLLVIVAALAAGKLSDEGAEGTTFLAPPGLELVPGPEEPA